MKLVSQEKEERSAVVTAHSAAQKYACTNMRAKTEDCMRACATVSAAANAPFRNSAKPND